MLTAKRPIPLDSLVKHRGRKWIVAAIGRVGPNRRNTERYYWLVPANSKSGEVLMLPAHIVEEMESC